MVMVQCLRKRKKICFNFFSTFSIPFLPLFFIFQETSEKKIINPFFLLLETKSKNNVQINLVCKELPAFVEFFFNVYVFRL